MVADIMAGGGSLPTTAEIADGQMRLLFGAAGGRVYVAADDGSHGRELWSWEP